MVVAPGRKGSAPFSSSDYTPIADYGVIGNLRTTALISTAGSLDWCCLPDLDSPSVFAAILDRARGGRFRVAPAGPATSTQAYLPATNILQTTFRAAGGTLAVTDFMPLENAPPEVHRVLACSAGEVDVEVEWSPRFDYARARMEIRGAVARAGGLRMALAGLPVTPEIRDGPTLYAHFHLSAGKSVVLVSRFDSEDVRDDSEHSRRAYEKTRDGWLAWVHRCDRAAPGECGIAGRWHDQVVRSGLALKLLTYAHTGALAAAATTSLPERIGGVRNWDYRFTWIRDAAFTVQALFSLGHHREAFGFLEWARRVTKDSQPFGLQIMYGLRGETELPETVLGHLEGYRGSRPVRIGNGAAKQRQLDVYGELMGAAFEVLRWGATMDAELWRFLAAVTDLAAARWQEPDHGIWEVRGGPRQFVYSKVMVWVALDRAIHLAQRFGLPGNVAAWQRARIAVRAAILHQGYDERLGAFVQSFGSRALDAANLLIPMLGFLPFDDPRVQGTIDRTLERLTEHGVVYRYLSDDGLPGGEGAFGLATFWLVDALALSGRTEESRALLEGMAGRANHLGLYAEEFDPRSGALLGNFPQAFTHTGFINAAIYLERALGKRPPVPAPMGSQQHRAESGHEPGAAA
ncbi:MAG TPA: glycoside hydrolase family 15 protein [Gemmatimonadales bacterium]|nr:glycoside hydrolase family 15 protein [Gemmatimonadales bacterium]